jgi:hypothetical protein
VVYNFKRKYILWVRITKVVLFSRK